MDPGCYCIDILRYAFSEEPRILTASLQCVSPNVDGEMQARLSFPSGGSAVIHSSLTHKGEGLTDMDMWFEVKGDQGTMTVKNPFLPQLGHELRLSLNGCVTTEQFDPTPSYVYQARHVLAVMRGERMALTPGSAGVGTMRALDSIYCAAGLLRRGERA
jgi:predicted dehydrogenase